MIPGLNKSAVLLPATRWSLVKMAMDPFGHSFNSRPPSRYNMHPDARARAASYYGNMGAARTALRQPGLNPAQRRGIYYGASSGRSANPGQSVGPDLAWRNGSYVRPDLTPTGFGRGGVPQYEETGYTYDPRDNPQDRLKARNAQYLAQRHAAMGITRPQPGITYQDNGGPQEFHPAGVGRPAPPASYGIPDQQAAMSILPALGQAGSWENKEFLSRVRAQEAAGGRPSLAAIAREIAGGLQADNTVEAPPQGWRPQITSPQQAGMFDMAQQSWQSPMSVGGLPVNPNTGTWRPNLPYDSAPQPPMNMTRQNPTMINGGAVNPDGGTWMPELSKSSSVTPRERMVFVRMAMGLPREKAAFWGAAAKGVFGGIKSFGKGVANMFRRAPRPTRYNVPTNSAFGPRAAGAAPGFAARHPRLAVGGAVAGGYGLNNYVDGRPSNEQIENLQSNAMALQAELQKRQASPWSTLFKSLFQPGQTY